MAKDKLKEDIYKIDLSFDEDTNEEANEDVDDDIYKLDNLDSDETKKEKNKKKKSLKKIEEGIRSSKTDTKPKSKTKDKIKDIDKDEKLDKATKNKTKTSKATTKTTRTKVAIASVAKDSRQNEIKMHTENNLTEIALKQNKYKIEMQKNEYNIYTEDNDTSYIIVREPSLRLVAGGLYILIERQSANRQSANKQDESEQETNNQVINDQVINGQSEEYIITTNQDFKINYVIDNLERKDNVVNFKLTNLTQIEAIEDGLIFEIDEEKIIENNLEDNNTLVISEEDGKVYLPYTKDEIKNEVLQNKGTKVADVIEEKYIIPLDKYKNSMRARFREGYNLMYQREGKSKKSAIMLGIELMFESNLHPAIISACKNLEELDIYLDCLEDNELEKFSCFKIIYKSLPTLRKKTKYQEI